MILWFDIYTEFFKNFEKISQLQQDYIRNLERINPAVWWIYQENWKSKWDLYKFIDSYEKMATSYEQQFDNIQKNEWEVVRCSIK